MTCNTMLIAYDGSDNARRAIDTAARFIKAERVVLLTAWEPIVRQAARMSGLSGVTAQEWIAEDGSEDMAHADAMKLNADGIELARRAGIVAEGRCEESMSAIWSTIVDVADDVDADIIVTGTRGLTGLRALLQSSVADHVFKHSHRPVMVVPPGE